jgi:hypothetical protein
MWETISNLIDKLPSWYLQVLVPILVAVGIWIFAHLRRDKQGKLYFHSSIYEQKKHSAKIDKVIDTVEHMSLDMLRLQLFNEGLPMEERLLAGARYTEGGGNGPSGIKFDQLKTENAELWLVVQNLRGKV